MLSSLQQPFLTSTSGMGFVWHGQVQDHTGPCELEFLLVTVLCAFTVLECEMFLQSTMILFCWWLLALGLKPSSEPWGEPVWAGAGQGSCPTWAGVVTVPELRGSHQGWSHTWGGHWLEALWRAAELLVSGLVFAKHSGTPLAANLGVVTVRSEGLQEQKRGFWNYHSFLSVLLFYPLKAANEK